MPFSVKMAESQLALYKKHQRRQNRSKSRQAVFISEYVFFKHFHIYQEAAKMYNEINLLYPRKPDLRRTEEFRVWRNNVTGRPDITRKSTVKRRPYVFPVHPNIPVAEHIDPNVSFVVVDRPESPHSQSLQPESPHSESLQPESPHSESLGMRAFWLEAFGYIVNFLPFTIYILIHLTIYNLHFNLHFNTFTF